MTDVLCVRAQKLEGSSTKPGVGYGVDDWLWTIKF